MQDQCRSILFSDKPQLWRMEILHTVEHMGYQVLTDWCCNTWFKKFLHILLIITISVGLTQQTSQSSWALQEVFQRYNGVNQRALVSTEGKAGGRGDNKNRQSATKHEMRLEGYYLKATTLSSIRLIFYCLPKQIIWIFSLTEIRFHFNFSLIHLTFQLTRSTFHYTMLSVKMWWFLVLPLYFMQLLSFAVHL